MKKVYFTNFSMTINPGAHRFLPYASGTLWSYAQTHDDILRNYELGGIFFEKEEIEDILEKMHDPYIIGMSCYNWNEEYNNRLSIQIKQRYPDCLIVYGGPSVPDDINNIWYKDNWFVDVVVRGEGEIPFVEILRSNNKESMASIQNVSVNFGSHWSYNYKKGSTRIRDLTILPSPYTNGIIPIPMENHAMLFETNRGCPYACTFCDWGGLTYTKVSKHDMQRIKEEIEWMGKNKVGFVYNVDANFGIFKERDMQIVDWLVETKKKYGYPLSYFVNWAKNSNETILEMAKKLYDVGLVKSFIMSLQTLTPTALEKVKRDNMAINEFAYLAEKCKEYGMPFDTELILGNPGETVAGWKETYIKLTNYQGLSTCIAPLAILPNAEMATQEQFELHKFRIESVAFPGVLHEDIPEVLDLVVEHETLTEHELKYLWEWTWTTRLGQEFNFIRDAADYLDAAGLVDKYNFYDNWHLFISENNHIMNKHFRKAKERIDQYIFGLASQSYGFREGLSSGTERAEFYKETKEFLRKYIDNDEFLDNLIKYCDARLFNPDITYPLTLTFDYDFTKPAQFAVNKLNQPITIEFTTTMFGSANQNVHYHMAGSKVLDENYKDKITRLCTITKPTVM
jgi:hypothetical protein